MTTEDWHNVYYAANRSWLRQFGADYIVPIYFTSAITLGGCILVVSSYKESRNNKPIYGYMLPNLSPSPNLYKVQSVYNNNVAS